MIRPHAVARAAERGETTTAVSPFVLPASRVVFWIAIASAYVLGAPQIEALANLAGPPFEYGAAVFAGAMGIVATLWLVERRALIRAGGWIAFAATFVAALTMLDALHPGSGAWTWLFAAALLLALERGAGPIVPACITVLWCNCSPNGVLAPAIALLFAVGSAVDDEITPRARALFVIAAACAAATLATPAFVTYWPQALTGLRLERGLSAVMPLHPADVAPHSYRIGFFAIVALAALAGPIRRSASDALLFVFAALLALANGTFLPLAGIVVCPIVAGAFSRERFGHVVSRNGSIGRWLRSSARDLALVAPAACVAAGIAFGGLAISASQRALAAAPAAMLAQTGSSSHPHRVLCTTLAWCDGARAFGVRSVLANERVETFSSAALRTQAAIVRTRPGWLATLAGSGLDAVIAGRREPLAALLQMHGWRRGGSDDRAILLLPATSGAR